MTIEEIEMRLDAACKSLTDFEDASARPGNMVKYEDIDSQCRRVQAWSARLGIELSRIALARQLEALNEQAEIVAKMRAELAEE